MIFPSLVIFPPWVRGAGPRLRRHPPRAGMPQSTYEKRIEMFNEHVTATAARHQLALVDLHALSRELAPGRPEMFCPDGFHPSESGYEVGRTYLTVEALLREEASVR